VHDICGPDQHRLACIFQELKKIVIDTHRVLEQHAMMVRAVLPCCSQLDSGSRKRRQALASHRPTETLPSTLRGLIGPEDMAVKPRQQANGSQRTADGFRPSTVPSLMLVDLADNRTRPLPVKMQPETAWRDVAHARRPRGAYPSGRRTSLLTEARGESSRHFVPITRLTDSTVSVASCHRGGSSRSRLS
jgi:hypothetical protein